MQCRGHGNIVALSDIGLKCFLHNFILAKLATSSIRVNPEQCSALPNTYLVQLVFKFA